MSDQGYYIKGSLRVRKSVKVFRHILGIYDIIILGKVNLAVPREFMSKIGIFVPSRTVSDYI